MGFRDDSKDMLPDELVISALIDITNDDEITLSALNDAIVGKPKVKLDGGLMFPLPKKRAFDLMSYALYYGNKEHRAALIDGKGSYQETLDEFQRLYKVYEISWPDNIQIEIEKLASDMKPGQPIGFVLALLSASASEAGYEILNINSASNFFLFFLCKKEFSSRWRNSNVGRLCWIENPQWQFVQDFEVLGVKVDYPAPPDKKTKRTL